MPGNFECWRCERLTLPAVNNVTVIEGNKSAVEAMNLCTIAGKTVAWLIRRDGKGPGILFTTRTDSGQYRAAQGASRWSSVFRPGIYAARPWIHRFFYSGEYPIGVWICKCFWKLMTKMMLKRYESVEGNKKLLNPETKE